MGFRPSLGYTVTVNEPYTGGTIVQRIGNPARGVHSVQVEINRALYLDEGAVTPAGGFSKLGAALEELTRQLAARSS